MELRPEGVAVRDTNINPQELRCGALFWDHLVWPLSRGIAIIGGDDEEFLRGAGALSRPAHRQMDSVNGFPLLNAYVDAFKALEAREPGRWALAQGETALIADLGILEADRGELVELHRAVPIPAGDVPLAEILEFKERRRDALLALRGELTDCYLAIESSGDPAMAAARQFAKVDAACADMLKLVHDGVRFQLGSLTLHFSRGAAKGGVSGYKAGEAVQMPIVGATLGAMLGGGIASAIRVAKDFGLQNNALRSSPYRYVYHAHDEVFL
jgi:hypothetical protein